MGSTFTYSLGAKTDAIEQGWMWRPSMLLFLALNTFSRSHTLFSGNTWFFLAEMCLWIVMMPLACLVGGQRKVCRNYVYNGQILAPPTFAQALLTMDMWYLHGCPEENVVLGLEKASHPCFREFFLPKPGVHTDSQTLIQTERSQPGQLGHLYLLTKWREGFYHNQGLICVAKWPRAWAP